MEYYLQLEIWKGNIRGALQKASEREELSDWLVAMAPLASYDTWRGVCEEYAGQLERDGQYHKASLFLLASHHVHPAIELFKRHRLFKEAVTLARIRLSPLDPMLEDLYTEWANHLMKEGNYEQAAKCYLALKQVQDAAKVLTRRCDQPTLRTACQMTLIANEKQQGLALAYRSLQGFLARHQWSQALASLHDHQALKVFVPFVGMHELVMRELRTLAPAVLPEVDSSLFTIKEEAMAGVGLIPDFILDLGEADPVLPWRPHVIGEHSFPHHVLRCWQASLTMETEALRQMYRTLSQLHSVRQSYLDIPQILVQVSLDLTLFLLGLLLSETSQAIGHLLQAMSSLHEAEQFSLMQAVCQLMLPLGPKYVLKLQQEVTAFSVLISMERNIGDVEGTAKAQTIRRFLSELREDSVSSSGHRCRELDCLRAYCYLAALHCLQDSVEGNGSPTAASTMQDNASSSEGTCLSSVSVRRNEASGVSGDCSSKPNSDGKPQQSVPSGLHTKSSCSESEGGGDAVQTGETGSQKPAQDSKKSYSVSSATSGSVCKSRDLSQGRVTAQDRDGKTSTTEGVQSGSNSGEVASQPDVLKTGPDVVSTAKAGGEGTGVDKDQDGSGRVKVTLSCLLQLSQGLLWDVQAKRVALTETLGYIHRAISQHLLAERPHPPEQSKSLGSSGKTQGTSSSGEEPPTGSHMEGSSVDSASGIPTPADKKLLYSQLSVDESDPCGLGLGAGVGPDVIPKGRRVLWEDDTSQCLPGEMGSCGHMCMGTHTHPHPHHHSHPQSHPHSAVVPRYPSVPEEWYSMSVDTKYTCPYVTMMILRQEQDLINHELKRVPDSSQMPFPNPLDSVHMLLRLSQGRLTRSEQMDYRSRLVTWAMQYAVTSVQRSKLQSYELPHHQP